MGLGSLRKTEEEEIAIQEAASAGMKSMEHLVRLLSSSQQQKHHSECREATEATVSKFKRLISVLNRTGHARFRRAPSNLSFSSHSNSNANSNSNSCDSTAPSSSLDLQGQPNMELELDININSAAAALEAQNPAGFRVRQPLTLDFTNPTHVQPPQLPPSMSISMCNNNSVSMGKDKGKAGVDLTSFSISSSANSSSFMSSITGEGSVSNGKPSSSLFLSAPTSSSGKPPLSSSSSHKKRCHDHHYPHHLSASPPCHCSSKRRKLRVKKTIRVPAISSKIADIPVDDYSWRKYGQKPIKGSPYPRGYYKCSTVRGCPARKHVERASDDPTMLIVTYEGDHRHSSVPTPTPTPAPTPSSAWLVPLSLQPQSA